MFDRDTLIISYDTERGEPRGPRGKRADPAALGLGACVDCGLCVQVCPTGIDIRQGLQYECIGCAACVDVCDGIMDKMGYAPGLIRYATENGLEQHLNSRQMLRRIFRPRVLVYTAILLALCIAFGLSVALRKPFRVDVDRDRSSLARIVEDGQVENVYRLQIMNSAETAQRYRVKVEGMRGLHIAGRAQFEAQAAEALWVTLDVQLPPDVAAQAGSGAHTIHFEVERIASAESPYTVEISERSTFIVPR
jgi:cytochrome c oxidase accessory protein FixG